jgi:hypothetical protein
LEELLERLLEAIMSETKSITINMGWTGAFAYLACGMLYHLVMSEVPFAWGNPWLYVDMALWPLWLFGWFLVLVVLIIAIGAAVFGGAHILDWNDKRKRIKAYEKGQEEERRRIAQATPPKSR